MSQARIAAVLTWVYAAGFGISTIPVTLYLSRRGTLPTFFGLFEMYGGPWSSRVSERTFVWLLIAFLIVALAVAGAAWLVWRGSRVGGVVAMVLLLVEAVFWIGFACRSHGCSGPHGQPTTWTAWPTNSTRDKSGFRTECGLCAACGCRRGRQASCGETEKRP